jgi:protein tyrosine/serine phosphatase
LSRFLFLFSLRASKLLFVNSMQIFLTAALLWFFLCSPSAPFPQNALTPSANSDSASHSSAISSSSAEKIPVRGLPNLGKVSEQLFRGAQPDLSNLDELKKLGVTTIVDLRGESSGTREQERARAEALGIHFVAIPVGGFSNPSSAQLAQFFSLVRQTPPEKIFVHCRLGHDRTGVFIAAYRIAFDHWTVDRAVSEMNSFGFSQTFHPGMLMYVRDLPDRLHSDPILKSSLN